MSASLAIRDAVAADAPLLGTLYRTAFPGEDLRALVREIAGLGAGALPLVAMSDGALVGHAAFTFCRIDGAADEVALLGPVAMDPRRQRQGIGSALIRLGLDRLGRRGTRLVLVLGDPAYYRRFGFAANDGVLPPFSLPEAWREAWQSLSLRGGPELRGTLCVPPPWNRRALWAA